MDDIMETNSRRSMVTSLPSDFSDVQPSNYDPEFISAISNKMQVPDSISVINRSDADYNQRFSRDWNDGHRRSMNVPERITLAGNSEHKEIKIMNFDGPSRVDYKESVGLQTPPRTLTVQEQFPIIDNFAEEIYEDDQQVTQTHSRILNGGVAVPSMYSPETSAYNGLHDGDIVHRQLVQLSRRLSELETQQAAQSQRAKMMYSAALGYFMLKFVFWFLRNK